MKKKKILISLYALISLGFTGLAFAYRFDSLVVNSLQTPLNDTPKQLGTELPEIRGTFEAGLNLTALFTPDSNTLARGKEIYDISCTACHGTEGKGDGVAGAALTPKPRNFHSSIGWEKTPEIGGIFTSITKGLPGTAMAPYDTLPIGDRFALAHYIHAMNPENPKSTPNDQAKLDQLFKLTQGKKSLGQIPVSKAMELLASENLGTQKATEAALTALLNDESTHKIFKKVVNDPLKALTQLGRNSNWKSNPESLTKLISEGQTSTGFNSAFFQLDSHQLQQLHEALAKNL